jgi:hypothetical protein
MQAECHAGRVISPLNSPADEPFASTDLQLCAYNLEQCGTTAGGRRRLNGADYFFHPLRFVVDTLGPWPVFFDTDGSMLDGMLSSLFRVAGDLLNFLEQW